MRRGRFAALALALALAIVGIAGFAPGGGLIEGTSAAWTDRTSTSAVVTSGTWSTAATNTCTAYGYDGRALTGCTVSGITYSGWGEPGKQTRNYYVNFQTPAGTRSVSFDVDLSTATGSGGSWTWKNAKVLPGAQFTARGGWTCAQLPRVIGTGADWQVPSVYFQVAESGSSTTC
ncbi:SipW-dependent-type signal peptide-containing protein [Microbacterium aerolatum]|uniref:SipW-dependent-type signal peptide-containing protein n=1 Tax=Microbacterium aerolatum TaxID=153731 RepID=UPI0020017324|nr:SipW-dependent-type signal peptide-containing protein [Microbacterium aerolatum]MCK3769092.1 SipW-dependent-type signal peptide-containing protein [Microbacterium aerolatum]